MANPSGLLQGAIMMLNHIGQTDVAEKVQNAWLKTIEDGIHTYDIYREGVSREKVGTREFADAVIARLGSRPENLNPVSYGGSVGLNLPRYQRRAPMKKTLEGVDLFVHWAGYSADELAETVVAIGDENVKLSMITNRGIKVWPQGFRETFCTDHWRCRFKPEAGQQITKDDILRLMGRALDLGVDVVKTENLYAFDGRQAYSLGQGQ